MAKKSGCCFGVLPDVHAETSKMGYNGIGVIFPFVKFSMEICAKVHHGEMNDEIEKPVLGI